MDLSIVIVNWNTSALLRECLQTVFAGLGQLQAEILVVDNASSDGPLAMLAAEFPAVITIANASNLGFAAAGNVALGRAKERHMLLFNTDTLVHGSVLPDAVAWLDCHPDIGVLGRPHPEPGWLDPGLVHKVTDVAQSDTSEARPDAADPVRRLPDGKLGP